MTRFAFAFVASLALAPAAFAQSASPQIPDPANPYPANPVATDGTPLPATLFSGRSAYQGIQGLDVFGVTVGGSTRR